MAMLGVICAFMIAAGDCVCSSTWLAQTEEFQPATSLFNATVRAPASPLSPQMCNIVIVSTAMAILVTGGAGYIGSHTVVEMLAGASRDIVIVDSLVNASKGLSISDVKAEYADICRAVILQLDFIETVAKFLLLENIESRRRIA